MRLTARIAAPASPAATPARRVRGGVMTRLVAAATLAVVASGLVLVSPAAAESTLITTRVVDANPAYGEPVRVKGRVTGRKPGSKVHLKLIGNDGTNDTITRIATTRLGRYGRYSFTWQPPLVPERSVEHLLMVVAPQTQWKSEAWGKLFYVVTQETPLVPQTLRQRYLDITNDARAQAGVPPLVMVDQYNDIADAVAKETYDNGGAYPQDIYDRFPSNITPIIVCIANGISWANVYSPVTEVLSAHAVYYVVGVHVQPDGKATTIIYALAEDPSGN